MSEWGCLHRQFLHFDQKNWEACWCLKTPCLKGNRSLSWVEIFFFLEKTVSVLFEDVLGCGVVDFETVGCLLNGRSPFTQEGNELFSLLNRNEIIVTLLTCCVIWNDLNFISSQPTGYPANESVILVINFSGPKYRTTWTLRIPPFCDFRTYLGLLLSKLFQAWWNSSDYQQVYRERNHSSHFSSIPN